MHGGDLAIIDTNDKIEMIVGYLKSEDIYDSCSSIYIGLRNEEWHIPIKGCSQLKLTLFIYILVLCFLATAYISMSLLT